jgi:ketosteroid isomerase-like protein
MNQTTSAQSVKAAIQAANRAFEEAFRQGDAAAAAMVYTTNALAMPPNTKTVSGRAALQSFWQAVMDMGVKEVTLETVELDLYGEIATEVGKAILRGEGGAVIDTVKFIVVWQEEDGKWKWHRDIWNSENPA